MNNVAQDKDRNEFGGKLCAYQKGPGASKLAVAPCFLGPKRWVAGDYWIIDYDEEEGYALVSGGQPTIPTANGCRTGTGINDSGLWIFTREQNASDALVTKVRGIAQAQGFDVSMLKDVKQNSCVYDAGRRGLRGATS